LERTANRPRRSRRQNSFGRVGVSCSTLILLTELLLAELAGSDRPNVQSPSASLAQSKGLVLRPGTQVEKYRLESKIRDLGGGKSVIAPRARTRAEPRALAPCTPPTATPFRSSTVPPARLPFPTRFRPFASVPARPRRPARASTYALTRACTHVRTNKVMHASTISWRHGQ
jgi:hypothetical protein